MKIDSLNLKSVQGIMYSHLYEWPDMEEPLQLRYFIEIPMVSVNTVKANTKNVVDASLYLECIKFGGVQERNWSILRVKALILAIVMARLMPTFIATMSLAFLMRW